MKLFIWSTRWITIIAMAPDLETAIKKVSEEHIRDWSSVDPGNFVVCEEPTAVVIWRE